MTPPADELLLHHYDASPFSEKVRLAFGLKGLAWRSVVQPNMMPKPHLLPLTGGYRRIPVLQVGADVYCDTQLIARELDRRRPEPPLLPPAAAGLAWMVHFWADRLFFLASVPVLFERIAPVVPDSFMEDRRKLMGGTDLRRWTEDAPHYHEQLRAHAGFLEAQLADGRPFLLGEAPGWADLCAYHPVWFLRSVPPTAGLLAEHERLGAWAERVEAIGHGTRTECTPEEALERARNAVSETPARRDAGEPNGLEPGARVRVQPDDYGFDPVEGELVASDAHEVALRRESPETGSVVVHFPRAGFRVDRG